MPPKLLLPIALAALCAILLMWRMAGLQSQIAEMKAAARPSGEAGNSAHGPSAGVRPSAEGYAPAPSSDAGELEQTREELREAQAKIAELEGNLDSLTEAWNRFAEEEETKRKRASMRAWGPEQVTGEPDTHEAGDRVTAWASLQADAGPEWLQTEYANAVEVAQIRILENDNPGAVVKITGFLENGAEVVLWQGNEPQLPAPADQYFSVPAGYRIRSVRVHLDTAKVPGWNEIDAVELIGRDGSRQWASSATASSTYANPRGNQANRTRLPAAGGFP